MLALAHDQRTMRADRGYFCLPEVDIGIPFTPGMSALIAARLPVRTAHEAMTTGRRYGGEDAAAAGIADEAVTEEQVLPRAIVRAEAPGRQGPIDASDDQAATPRGGTHGPARTPGALRAEASPRSHGALA
jgi:Delta3-Delta2-enoyl-CoA isomerase